MEFTWTELERIYHTSLSLPEKQRKHFIEEECKDNESLKSSLLDMLEEGENADAFFDSLQSSIAEGLQNNQEPVFRSGDQIDKYLIQSLIGTGGMGEVYLAERNDGQFEQQVAIKCFTKTSFDATLLDRFRQEQQFLANLKHENIAQIYDGGVSKKGVPYIIMEYVNGTPIDQYHTTSERKALEIFLIVCDTIQHAHNQLILHLDIKPNNLLVSDRGVIKLLDFGVARRIDNHTASQQIMASPAYAAPEQLTQKPISVSTDIYQLGVLLHLLLVGDLPYDKETSTIHKQLKLAKGQLSHELQAIIGKCLKSSPEERYPSVNTLRSDLNKYLLGLPISTYSTDWRYKSAKYIKRNLGAVVLMSLLFISMIVGTSISLHQAHIAKTNEEKALEEKKKAERQAELANSTKNFVLKIFEEANPSNTKGDTTNIYDLLDKSYNNISSYQGSQEVKAEMYAVIASSYRSLDDFDRSEIALEKALNIFDSLDTKGNQSVITLLDNLALYHRDNGDYDKAAKIYKRLFSTFESLDLKKDSVYTSYLRNIAYIQKTRGLLDSAYSLINKTVDLESQILQDTISILYAETLYIKGSIEKDLKNYSAAIKTLSSALEIVAKTEGKIHPGYASILNNLAILYQRIDQFDRAIQAYEEKLSIDAKLYGDQSSKYAVGLDNYAMLLYKLDNFDKSLAYSRQANQVYRHVFGNRANYKYGISLVNTGQTYSSIGHLDSADYYLNEGLKMLNETNAPKKYISNAYLKKAYNEQRKKDTIKAFQYYDKCKQIREELGIDTSNIDSLKNLLLAKK
ncbi:serine/threonine-protein kinase [Reichenbachiella ulvae]|uniref:Serine/threonine-protein kinase n=1 Tax=Reichenbachiella ulvae TaxID=2980104 RepID=A0ABT3CTR1_9BACT|nr:serine/threonine-protein kinase [Reichenbachiella ulvae]MCV9387100.1 serine/threonine-protein kinase [Reichenbachiella ulvae]